MDKLRGSGDANAVMAALAFETYAMVEEMLNEIIDRQWMDPNSKLVLLGGIMINVDGEAPDLFLPLNFESHTADGTVTDLMEEAFGKDTEQFAQVSVPRRCPKGT